MRRYKMRNRLLRWRSGFDRRVAMIATAVIVLDRQSAFPGWWALLPTAGTALVIAAGPTALFTSAVLSLPVLVFIGLISYPLYLWHWVLLSVARNAWTRGSDRRDRWGDRLQRRIGMAHLSPV